MSVPERLRELETDVRDLPFTPAGRVRARGRSRGRRQMAALATAGAVVVVTAGLAYGRAPQPATAPAAPAPAAPAPSLACVLTLPGSPAEVQVRLVGGPAGVADELRARQFAVTADPAPEPARTTAVRYGPAAIGAAALVRAYLPGDARMTFDPARRDATVDLVAGPDLTRLARTTEVNENLVADGAPTAPPEC
jgi:hypothetical protein